VLAVNSIFLKIKKELKIIFKLKYMEKLFSENITYLFHVLFLQKIIMYNNNNNNNNNNNEVLLYCYLYNKTLDNRVDFTVQNTEIYILD